MFCLRFTAADILSVVFCRSVYVALIKELEWEKSKVSMLTDDSSGEFPVYHQIINEKFKDYGITLATRELLPRIQYLTESATPGTANAYGKVNIY